MSVSRRQPRRRPAFTLIELLVVISLILLIFGLGIGYIIFSRDSEKNVLGAQSVGGAILNAKQRARRDGRPTGLRFLFGTGTTASQLQYIQQPEDYNAGLCTGNASANVLNFQYGTVDFVGGGDPGNTLTWTVQPGDYFFMTGAPTPHLITGVTAGTSATSPPTLTLASAVTVASGTAYNVVRAPRPIPSEDSITLPAGFVIDKSGSTGLPLASNNQDADLVFAPDGGVVGKGTGSNKIFLWICNGTTPFPTATGGPLILAIQVRTGVSGTYPVLPGNLYFYANDPRASGI